jgi:hypothetical protein
MTAIAKEVAETSFNDPPKSPIGVLVALTITTSLILFTFCLSLKVFFFFPKKPLSFFYDRLSENIFPEPELPIPAKRGDRDTRAAQEFVTSRVFLGR